MSKIHTKISLIRSEFTFGKNEALREIKALSPTDKLELASAIARNRNIPQGECDFTFVEY